MDVTLQIGFGEPSIIETSIILIVIVIIANYISWRWFIRKGVKELLKKENKAER